MFFEPNGERPVDTSSPRIEAPQPNAPETVETGTESQPDTAPDKEAVQTDTSVQVIKKVFHLPDRGVRVEMEFSENFQGHIDVVTRYYLESDNTLLAETRGTMELLGSGSEAVEQKAIEVVERRQVWNGVLQVENQRQAEHIHDYELGAVTKLVDITADFLTQIDLWALGKETTFQIQEFGSGFEKIVYRCFNPNTREICILKIKNTGLGGGSLGGHDFTRFATYRTMSGKEVAICTYVLGTQIGEGFFIDPTHFSKMSGVLKMLIVPAQAVSSFISSLIFQTHGRWTYQRGNSEDHADPSAHFLLEESERPFPWKGLFGKGVPLPCIREGRLVLHWFLPKQIDS